MTKEQFIDRIKDRLSRKQLDNLLVQLPQTGVDLPELIGLCFHTDGRIAFRSAWILESVFVSDPQAFTAHLELFLEKYPGQSNPSCRRHFSRILMLVLSDPQRSALPENLLLRATEATFNWLIDPETPVAVKANCLDVLFHLRSLEPWIEEELKQEIEFLLKDGSPAMQSRGRKILGRLR